MENILIYIVDSTEKSIAVNHTLADLDRNSDIRIYESITIRKTDQGGFDVLKDATEEGGWKTLGGGAIGALIGIVGGPLGLLLGGLTGTFIGATMDTEEFVVSTEFIDQVNNSLQVGEIAVITVVDETSPDFVDTALQPLEGRSFRTSVDEAYDHYQERVEKAASEEHAAEKAKREVKKAERKEKRAELRESVKKKISDWWDKL
ncbi:MAG TPA: hypothetical protein DEF78_01135 [Sphingobacterium sp.]|nr:hypothetical protein [Sphingobacterium sp.]